MRTFRKDAFILDKFEETSNGFLNISGFVTRNGVFKYDDANELRPYEEVFKEESLKTMFAVPVSQDHPPDLLTKQTIPQYQKGFVASHAAIKEIDEKISAVRLDNIIVQDAGLIELIKSKQLSQFSMGYTCDLIEQSGTFDGIDYSRVQKNIVYNHLAVVEDARCGKICSIIPREDSVKYKKDCACGHYKKDAEKMVEEVKKEEETKKDEVEEKAEEKVQEEEKVPSWVKTMLEQHEKMLGFLEKMSGAKEESEKSEESEEEDCMDEKDLEEKSMQEEKSMKEEKPMEKRKDSVKDVISLFKFVDKTESKQDSTSSFKTYNRDEYVKQLLNKGAK